MLNNFSRGVCSIGNLNPRPIEVTCKNVSSAWSSVAKSFSIVGDNLRGVIKREQKYKGSKCSKQR